MATYLRGFVESVSDLPAELQRCFGLMRELDSQATALQTNLVTSAQAAYDSMVSSASCAACRGLFVLGQTVSIWTQP